ncbi:MAG: restriction endonuclease subunit S [Treponema sp.]|nr:restriction endonuclease subunit S [Treponema sp.]
MSANYKKLGDYIQPVDVRNSDLKVSHLLGLSIEKCFIESIANTIGTDFRPYKIVKKGQFAYGPVTSRNGDKITIALLKEADVCIISSSYSVFEITDTTKLLPEYLMLWFSRPEFDRYARYKSHGSVREIFDWDEMCRVELPVPDLKEQEKIVNTYNAITKRIQLKQKINENLEKTAQCLFEEMFPNIIDIGNNRFEDIIDFSNGKSRPEEAGKIPVYGGNGIMSYTDKINAENCIAIGRVGAYCGSTYLCKSKCWISDNAIKAKYKFSEKQFFAYYLLKKANLFERHIGTGQQLLTQGILASIPMLKPSDGDIEKFNEECEPIENQLKLNIDEISKLQELKQLVISRISSM